MRLGIISVIVLLTAVNPARSAFDDGVVALSEKKYEQAIEYFLAEAASAPDEAVYFNLGLAYEGQNNAVAAIWAFEQALKYNPISNKAAANARLIFQEMNPEQDWKSPYDWQIKLVMLIQAEFWVVLAVLMSLLLATSVFLLFFPSASWGWKKVAKFSLPVWIILFAFSMFSLWKQQDHLGTEKYGLVTRVDHTLFVGKDGVPSEVTAKLGERFRVMECEDDWCSIQLNNGEVYWLSMEDLLRY